MKFRLFWKSE